MNTLPSSIEAYLMEAGFSGTEILVLRRLLEQEAVTLRQLAAKTGKSTGVLDQAMKKLLKKNIIQKEWVNESYKYALHSLEAVTQWMAQDIQNKREAMHRKFQNFSAFVSSLERGKGRPQLQFYEGEDGLKQAYRKLLDQGKEFLHEFPTLPALEEEDKLREFKIELFRERRRRGIFSRVIAHDTPLGRRFQSRDPFEYRKTILLSPEAHRFAVEKIVAGDVLACFNHAENKACLLSFPELAASASNHFEHMWRQQEQAPVVSGTQSTPSPLREEIPQTTKFFSSLREFLLGKTSVMAFCILAILAGGMTYGMYRYTASINLERVREQVVSVASTAAAQFDPSDFAALQNEKDWTKPEWGKVVSTMQTIRVNNPLLVYVYAFRKDPADVTKMVFVADSHSMDPYANTDADPTNDVDANGDGKIESDLGDKLQWPGQLYPEPPTESFLAYSGPIANKEVYEDSWGKTISGYAPIRDKEGVTVAVLAADIRADTIAALNTKTFAPILFFFALFFLFVLMRYAAFSRSLFQELLKNVWARSLVAKD